MADSMPSGIDVLTTDNSFLVSFPYDRDLVNKINKVPGAQFNKDEQAWEIPKSSADDLDKVVDSMHFELKALEQDRESIMKLAKISAIERMKDYGTEPGITAKISDYHKAGGNHSGEIINVNGRFAAQLTGFGNENGAAFVSIHRLANLNEPVYKGDDVRISYNNNGIGTVYDRSQVKSAEDLTRDFDATLDQDISGVMVGLSGDKYQIKFDFNPDMQQRLQRVAGAEFSKSAGGVWEVPVDVKSFVVRAVADMRKEFAADSLERNELAALAEQKLDGAKVRDAFTKDGLAHYGKIIAVSERYILQHGGQNEFKLHRKSSLGQTVSENQNLKITYDKGRGSVEDRKQEKEKSAALTR
ncbi:KfrB domain-containing protein [Methylovorus glucosotrophus]|uniref:KfrB domain-containing protein n=1 Tax=Methylovorus glucosotrophus (strain SIP3-4) TaxID=582744 RepID=C6XEQ6_METGS|nr:hypothetical protein [Methylovorus glucosotrophus]ACT52113.1 hypothetical protein Msip34_2889 [Methylovorus glucosotrophus SIP3-4]